MNKNPVISAAILSHIAQGKTLPQAMDAVLGAGTYAKVAGEAYEALRSKSQGN